MVTIAFSDFEKVDLRVGLVLESSIPEESEKLIKLSVDFGDPSTGSGREVRTIFTGLQSWYEPDFFQGKNFIFLYNF